MHREPWWGHGHLSIPATSCIPALPWLGWLCCSWARKTAWMLPHWNAAAWPIPGARISIQHLIHKEEFRHKFREFVLIAGIWLQTQIVIILTQSSFTKINDTSCLNKTARICLTRTLHCTVSLLQLQSLSALLPLSWAFSLNTQYFVSLETTVLSKKKQRNSIAVNLFLFKHLMHFK